MYKKYIKRMIDFALSIFGMTLLSPLYLAIIIWIKLESKGPVFFLQKRIGRKKRVFFIYKFRTMRMDTPKDVPTHLLENPQQYITRAGRFLRKTSLDELPQIVNILKGDMAIIGPRPALWNQYDLLKLRDNYGANDVRPGLTGLAQICGRDELPLGEKAKLDGEYCANICFINDFKIFFKTIGKVLHREGIAEGMQQTERRTISG